MLQNFKFGVKNMLQDFKLGVKNILQDLKNYVFKNIARFQIMC